MRSPVVEGGDHPRRLPEGDKFLILLRQNAGHRLPVGRIAEPAHHLLEETGVEAPIDEGREMIVGSLITDVGVTTDASESERAGTNDKEETGVADGTIGTESPHLLFLHPLGLGRDLGRGVDLHHRRLGTVRGNVTITIGREMMGIGDDECVLLFFFVWDGI